MTYTIQKKEQRGTTIVTIVDYNFDGRQVNNVEVQHFMPRSEAEIVTGIINRGESERIALGSTELNKELIAGIKLGEETPLK